MAQGPKSVRIHLVDSRTFSADVRSRSGRHVRRGLEVVEVLLLLLQPIHPRPPVCCLRTERPNALCEEKVAGVKVAAQVDDLHGPAVRAVHLQIRDESPACRPELRPSAFAFDIFSQREQLVNALFRLQLTRRLSLADIRHLAFGTLGVEECLSGPSGKFFNGF